MSPTCIFQRYQQFLNRKPTKMFKNVIKSTLLFPFNVCHSAFKFYDTILSNIFPQLKGFGRQRLINHIDNDVQQTKHGSASFKLYTPNRICNFRHGTFSTKEPELLEWIEKYGGGVFFDIGANIGIYSLFLHSSKTRKLLQF